MRTVDTIKSQDDRHRIAARGVVDETGLGAVEGDPERAHHLFGGDSSQHGLLAIDEDFHPRTCRLDLPVHIDHAIGGLKDLLDLSGNLEPTIEARSVDLRHERRKDRRTRWDLGNLDVDTEPFDDGRQRLSYLVGKGVRFVGPFVFVDEVDLDIGHVAARA